MHARMTQGLYRNDEREGPGVMTYSDGRRDVGLWQRERLIKLCTKVDGVNLDLASHGFLIKPSEYQQYLPKIAVVRQTLERLGSADVLPPRAPQPLVYGYEPSPELISRSVVSDVLPTSCLAADLQSFDEAFFAAAAAAAAVSVSKSGSSRCSQSNGGIEILSDKTDSNVTEARFETRSSTLPLSDEGRNDGGVIAWNTTPSCISMQSHILRHSTAQRYVQFDVEAVTGGDRCGVADDRGPVEISSTRLISAAAAGDMSTVVELIDEGEVNVDVADRGGHTALFAATV